jgi:predicted secreted protein
MTFNCALNTNKADGTLTVLLSILQDKNPNNIIIHKIKTPQWYNAVFESKSKANFMKNIERMIRVDAVDT